MNTFLIASLKINLYVHIRTKYIKVLELGAFLESPEVRGVFLNFLQVNSDQAATTIYILKRKQSFEVIAYIFNIMFK